MYLKDQGKFIEFEEGEGVIGKETREVNMVMLSICDLYSDDNGRTIK